AQEDDTCGSLTLDGVRDRALDARDAEEALLRLLDTLGDSRGHLLGLPVADAYRAVAVADDDERREAEAAAALDDLRDAVDRDDALEELALVARVATVVPTVVPTLTAALAALGAASTTGGAGRVALWSSHQWFLRSRTFCLTVITARDLPRARRRRRRRHDRGTCCRRGRTRRPRCRPSWRARRRARRPCARGPSCRRRRAHARRPRSSRRARGCDPPCRRRSAPCRDAPSASRRDGDEQACRRSSCAPAGAGDRARPSGPCHESAEPWVTYQPFRPCA